MAKGGVGAPTRRQFTLISTSFFASSGLGLLLLVVVARWLSPADNARFLAIWGLVFAFGSVLGAMEQEVTRRAAVATLEGERVPIGAVQIVGAALIAVAAVFGVLLLVPVGQRLLGGSGLMALLVFVALGGFAVQILVRGLFMGRHQITYFVVVIVAEAVVRLLVMVLLVLRQIEPSVEWAVLATVSGCFGWIPVVRRVLPAVAWRGARERWRTVWATVAALGMANALSSLALTGFPAVATLVIGAPQEMAKLFAVITVARVPLVLLAPIQALMVPVVLRWVRCGDTHMLARVLSRIAGGALATAVVGGAVGYALGPWAVRLLLGEAYRPDGLLVALIVGATCVMAAALLQAAVLVALERFWSLTACWAVAMTIAGLLMTFLDTTAEQRGQWGLVGASFTAFVLTAAAVRMSTVPAPLVAEPSED